VKSGTWDASGGIRGLPLPSSTLFGTPCTRVARYGIPRYALLRPVITAVITAAVSFTI